MKRNLILLMVFLLFSVKNLQAQEPKEISLDQIVQKVKEQKKQQKVYLKDYIFKSLETNRELDSKGKVKHETKTEKKINVKGDLSHEEILSIHKDGKFLDQKEIEKVQEEQNKGEIERSKKKGKTLFPFDPEENEKFDYYFIKEDTLNGVLIYLLRVEPKKKDENFLDDFYWIDQKSFGVLKEEQRLSKKQKFVKEMSGERIFQEIEIKDTSDAHIFIPVSTKMKGEGGFLFLKKKFEMEMVYSEFQLNVGISDEIFPRRK